MATTQQSNTAGSPLPHHPNYTLMALAPAVGLFSAILTIIMMKFRPMPPFAGIIFGGLIGGWLVIAKALSKRGCAWFALVATGTLPLSACAALLSQLLLGHPMGIPSETGRAETMPAALFVGGLFGGLILLGALSLIRREPDTGTVISRGVIGALLGGALATLGAALAPSLGARLWGLLHVGHLAAVTDLLYGEASFVYSLFVVWQTGMAAVIGLMLLRYGPEPEQTAAIPDWLQRRPNPTETKEHK